MRTKKKGWIAFVLVLGMFVTLTGVLQLSSRESLRSSALEREASSHMSALESFRQSIDEEFLEEDLLFVDLGMEELVHDDNDYLEAIALRALEIPETVGVFAFDKKGDLLELPTNSTGDPAEPVRLMRLQQMPFDLLLHEKKYLSILYPIGERGELGTLELLVDPTAILKERTVIDSQIFRQGVWAFLIGGSLLFLTFKVLMSRLILSEREILNKSNDLKEANLRLSQACKTAGVGAVTAHLMHALKTPLMGLKNIELGSGDHLEATGERLKATTQRIESLITQTLNTLRECDLNEESHSFQVQEILTLAANHFNDGGSEDTVCIPDNPALSTRIDNLKANLLLPILHNLIQNSVDGGPKTKVFLQAQVKEGKVLLRVSDNGPGIPDHYLGNLFNPVQSAKENGSGIGLAICKELAGRAGALIKLEKNSDKGTTFSIETPLKEDD